MPRTGIQSNYTNNPPLGVVWQREGSPLPPTRSSLTICVAKHNSRQLRLMWQTAYMQLQNISKTKVALREKFPSHQNRLIREKNHKFISRLVDAAKIVR